MTTRTRGFAALALLPLALSACGGGDDATDTSRSASASASPSMSARPAAASASATPAEAPTTAATESAPVAPETTEAVATEPAQAAEAPDPEQVQTQQSAAATVQSYFANGGGCIADVWKEDAAPYSPELAEQVYAYCSANRLGDWASGVDPRDPANLGNPEDHTPDAEEPTIPRAYCENLDHDTATSGEIQSCYMEYGL